MTDSVSMWKNSLVQPIFRHILGYLNKYPISATEEKLHARKILNSRNYETNA